MLSSAENYSSYSTYQKHVRFVGAHYAWTPEFAKIYSQSKSEYR